MKLSMLIAASAMLAACSSIPAPTEQMAVGRSSIEAARSAGAPEFAPAELAKAQSKYDQAEREMKQERYLEARRLAEQAAVDAKLAQAMAGNARERAAAAQVDQSIQALRIEIDRAAVSAPAR